ncbi:phosphatidylserine decarboxylase family protein, putative (macronuclear) [Tetrahymena thermophila SB210]|uniref:Phosphatidylserine decarboxylase family protein, putative n=1 Tax=Tetrahymena thermophila (strain SB210) TaxID=312017 RepID=I7M7Q4_TETTS|nr:phosphatidylserine decarboxylase family protein, putative [Tetrahymena thermophila SB210]EAR95644.2 phosphatidylserine decarboxylase family protein, putative [Tetrahymena thermophila SB210]|eukprot:XP_001015889.2 phosphatidylserine decarboxylase family protein, putative [Tetrahymena thermophila SB210]
MKLISEHLKQVDIFAQPFTFSFPDNEKKKKTKAGGIFSCLVYIFLIGYFTYLCYLYFSSQINPSISQTTQLYDQNFTLNLTNNIFAFQLNLPNGQSIQELEQSTGLVYLNVIPSYNYIDENGNSQQIILNFVQCSDPALSKFYCLDFSAAGISQTAIIMPFDPNNIGSYSISLLFVICDPQFLQPNEKCATFQQIRQQVLRLQTQGVMRMTTSQYNSKTKQYETSMKQEIFGFSDGLTYSSQIILEQSNTKVTQGYLIQNESQANHLSGYQRQDQFLTNQFVEQELQIKVIAQIQIYIGQNGINQQIQFPPFTSILAQFSSVMNIALISGIIISTYTQKEIVEDLMDIELKTYFKKTANNLIQKKQQQKQKQKQQQLQQQQDQQSLSQRLVNAYKSLQKVQIGKNIQKYFQISFFQRFKVFFVDHEVKKDDSDQLIKYKQMYKEAIQQMSIFEIQKQLLQVKMMLRILFTAEQFAAIQLCGNEIEKSDQNEKLNFITQSDKQDFDQKEQEKNIKKKQEKYQLDSEMNKKGKKSILKIPETYSPNQNFISNRNTIDVNNYNLDSQKIENAKEYELQAICQVDQSRQNNVNQEKEGEENYLQQMQQSMKNAQNHLEKINLIESNMEYFQIYLERFLDKNYIKSDLDYRILNCMINVDKEEDIEIK